MTADPRTHLAAELVARHEAKTRASTNNPVTNVDAWLRTEIPRRHARHRDLWTELLAETPTLTARDLAAAVTNPDSFTADRNAAGITRARDAIAERDMRRLRHEPPLCARCDDVGIWFDDQNLGHECDCNTQPNTQQGAA